MSLDTEAGGTLQLLLQPLNQGKVLSAFKA
jgi:hypothetical protein